MTGEIMNKHQLEETQRRIREDNTFWRARVNELKDQVAALREALKPFAEVADDFDADGRDLKDTDGIYANTAGDFRRARQALGDSPHD